MSIDFAGAMRRATERVRAQDPAGATAIIRAALAGRTEPAAQRPNRARPPVERAGAIDAETAGEAAEARPATRGGPARPRFRLGEAVRQLREGRAAFAALDRRPAVARASVEVPAGARWLGRRFSCAAGARDCRIYAPASATTPRGLLLMLHGCRQDPEDFAVGTGMNRVAEAHGFVVVYPAQSGAANASACWNWFDPGHQHAAAGEPAILAAMAEALAAEFGAPAGRVFVAGLSAGGAMAMVLGERRPDLFAGVGVHSGLPTGAALDVVSAFAAMRGEASPVRAARAEARPRRLIVFHGEADAVVSQVNGERLFAEARAAIPGATEVRREAAPGRRLATVERVEGPGGGAAEFWRIAGAGHAWSGGDPAGSWTDPAGPDASAEMARFLLGED